MGVPPNHPILVGFSILNHPAIGYHHLWKLPYEGKPMKRLLASREALGYLFTSFMSPRPWISQLLNVSPDFHDEWLPLYLPVINFLHIYKFTITGLPVNLNVKKTHGGFTMGDFPCLFFSLEGCIVHAMMVVLAMTWRIFRFTDRFLPGQSIYPPLNKHRYGTWTIYR